MIARRIASLTIGVLLLAPAVVAAPVRADAAPLTDCGGSRTGSGALATCSTNTPGGGRTKNLDWVTIKRYNDRPCVDSNGVASIRGVVFEPATGRSADRCLLRPGGGTTLVDRGSLQINAPKPTADFGDRFLTGAEVTFSVPEMTSYVQSLQQFPNATIVATPTKMFWDFGDGTTSNELSPKHTFLTKKPDPTKPGSNVVKVNVTGTWQLYLHPDGAGAENPVQDLGEVSLTGALERPIVEVWSAQTEPRN